MEKKKTNDLWSIYGARESKSGDRINISIVKTTENDEKVFGTISLKKEGGKVATKLNPDSVVIKIKRLDIDKEDL